MQLLNFLICKLFQGDFNSQLILQILRFLRPDVPSNKGCSNLAISLQGLRAYMEISDNIKESIKQTGGNSRASLPFNRDDSTSEIFKPSEGKQKRCITIPHKAIPTHLLVQLKNTGKRQCGYCKMNINH